MSQKIKIVSLIGPTASGKTGLGVALAKRYGAEIVSADSMQIYREMSIATAKPTDKEKDGIIHHLMDFLPPDKDYSVAAFVKDAEGCIRDIVSRGKLPILVGGTGLYVDSLLNNIKFHDEKRDEAYSELLKKQYEEHGAEPLLNALKQVDPESFERLEPGRNPRRIIRALEFFHTTGIPLSRQNEESLREETPYAPVKLGLNFRDREKLYSRINLRVDKMLEEGLLEEARQVLSDPLSFTSAKAIGYKELEPYFKNEKTLDECIEKLKTETRRYAKRQITWFKRDKEINWLYVDEYDSFEELFNAAVLIIDKGLMYGQTSV